VSIVEFQNWPTVAANLLAALNAKYTRDADGYIAPDYWADLYQLDFTEADRIVRFVAANAPNHRASLTATAYDTTLATFEVLEIKLSQAIGDLGAYPGVFTPQMIADAQLVMSALTKTWLANPALSPQAAPQVGDEQALAALVSQAGSYTAFLVTP
jgi:hypothetical protein